MKQGQPLSFILGKWLVEPPLGKLSKNGSAVSIRPREMDLLVYLAQHHGSVVTTNDIIKDVWAGVAVTNDSLYFSMSQLRKALDIDESAGSVIETLPKRGYRLLAPVEFPADAPADEATIVEPIPVEAALIAGDRPRSRSSLWFGLAAIALVMILVGTMNPFDDAPAQIDAATPLPVVNSIAVMPFVDLTPETDYTYFSDGITEEILNRLTRIEGLRVAARTSSFSFKNKESDIVEIGRSLGVTSILEGSVRKEGDRVRISVQLIDATTGFQLWSNTYERELSSVFAIQNEISRRIIDALQLTLASSLPATADTEERVMNPLALDEYLMGLEAHRTYSFESLRRAEDHFETVLQLDPAFSQARVQLADTKFSILNTGASFDKTLVDEAEALVREALLQDPDNGAAHRVLALVYKSRGDWEKSEQALNQALVLIPSDSQAVVQLAKISMFRGEFGEALELLGRALRIDPFGASVLQSLGIAQQRVGRFRQARETFARAIDLHPENPNSPWMLGKLQVNDLGEISGGLRSFLSSAEIDQDDYEIAAYVAMTYLSLEMPAEAEPWMRRALEDGPGTVTSIALETVYLMLTGAEDRATQLAIDALLDRPSRFGSHSMLSDSLIIIAVDQLIEQGRADEAVQLLIDAAPRNDAYSMQAGELQRHDAMLARNDMPRRWLVALACAYRATGESQKAAETLEKIAVARLGAVEDYRENLSNNDFLIEAEALAIEGDTNGAFSMLEAAVDANLYFNWQIRIQKNYAFAGLRADPRFIALIDRVQQKIHAERQSVPDPQQLAVAGSL